MNKNNEKIYSFLKLNGFELVQKDTSSFFGDYYDIFTNNSFQLRFSSSKSFETVDIRSSNPNDNWYDLALVKTLLYDEKNLTKATTIEEHKDFLQEELYDTPYLLDNFCTNLRYNHDTFLIC
ncbi:hypothetical protein JHJ32_21090 [Parapedobacter sp. ISTM3]|uniref:hypothetical protein n=1 Tax=Parapedobacter sp. ISTM3 TaxID=2800130 RepID=UPI0019082C86|nr:hypothetical protein [Parapedobacter sp. ISTM3]MBK1442508.1 hypothetical protein [Parapedobacter sp. ISTM3]